MLIASYFEISHLSSSISTRAIISALTLANNGEKRMSLLRRIVRIPDIVEKLTNSFVLEPESIILIMFNE